MQSKMVIKEKRFEIDTEGFKTQMSEMPLWRLVQELISNSFDEKSVSTIRVQIEQLESGKIHVQCIDDGDGFQDYKDVFTLYKDSYKRVNPKQRGRFNLGEKQFFAVAEFGSVYTKNWLIEFKDDERTIEQVTDARDGTAVNGVFVKPEKEDVDSIVDRLHDLVVPKEKILTLNGIQVEQKVVVTKFTSSLPTHIASGKNSKLVLVKRETEVILYEKPEEESALIYELGVPIQKLEDKIKWHIDIQQKVPQSTSRDVVSDKYLSSLYAEIAKNTLDLITEKDAGSSWVSDAMKKSDAETSKVLLTKIYGTENVMIESTTDYRANEKALEQGIVLIKGATLDPDVRKNLIKKTEVIKYAGKEFETTFGEAKPVTPNEDMIWFGNIVKKIAKDVVRKSISVEFYSMKESDTLAQYGSGTMSFNVARIGKTNFKEFSPYMIGIVIHELSHADDDSECSKMYAHLNMGFIKSLEKIGGKIGHKGINHWVNQ